MVKMALNLLALEKEIKGLQGYMNDLISNFQGLNKTLVTTHLKDRLDLMDAHLRAVLNQWPQLG